MKRQLENIGGVIIDTSFYSGEDRYSDGKIEDELLEIVKENRIKEALESGKEWPVLYHLSEIREHILEWFPFDSEARVLEIGSGCGAITGLLSRKVSEVTCVELSYKRSLINAYRNKDKDNISIIVGNFEDIKLEGQYDIVTLIGVLEYSSMFIGGNNPYFEMLQRIKPYLKKEGLILIGIENKMGLKYWNGAGEDHNGVLYSGLNDYVYQRGVRTFSKPELEDLLNKAGMHEYTFYYPMQDYKLPDVVYSDRVLPSVGEIRYYGQNYDEVRRYSFNEAIVFDQVCHDEQFEYFSNSFLICCGNSNLSPAFVKYAFDRKDQFRIVTKIVESEGKYRVIKSPRLPAGINHVINMKKNEELVANTMENMVFVNGVIEGQSYVLEYVDGKNLEKELFEYRNNGELFVDKLKEVISKWFTPRKSLMKDFVITEDYYRVFGSEYLKGKKCLPATNIDFILSNIRISDGVAVCFDLEWVFGFPIPFEYAIWRMLVDIYDRFKMYLNKHYSLDVFLDYFEISESEKEVYKNMEANFIEYVYGKTNEKHYLNKYRKGVI